MGRSARRPAAVNPAWEMRTGRLAMRPVTGSDLHDLVRLKGDPRAFAVMLGGVRSAFQTAEELAGEMSLWGRRGFGMWTLRDLVDGGFAGIAGLMERVDGRGVALRFALAPERHGLGYATEAAGAALRFAHERAGLARVVAVARVSNLGSRNVLGAVGMREVEWFERDAEPMLMYASTRP